MLAFPRPQPVPSQSAIARMLAALAVLALLALGLQAGPVLSPAPTMAALDRIPLMFTPNAGQAEPAVRFQAGGPRGALTFAPDAVALRLPARPTPLDVRLRFVAPNPATEIAGLNRQPGVVNAFIGADPARWRANLPAYAGIVYRQIYRGIDLRYEGTQGALKGTYDVAPGADPGRIRWRYDGAQSAWVDERGNLVVGLPGGAEIVEQAPVAWQETGGQRTRVDARYAVGASGEIGFALGAYDTARPLTIDPFLIYSAFVGGGKAEEGRDIAVDGQGNVYVTGTTLSPDFPSAGQPQATYAGPPDDNFGDAFVMKLNPAGNALVYMTYLGGSLQDIGDAITVDADGNAYVTGMTESDNFPTKTPLQPARGAQSCSNPPCSDAFVAKLNAAGNALVFSTYLGGSRDDNGSLLDIGTRGEAAGIAVDSARNVYVTGATESPDFPVKNQAFADTDGAFSDIFVSKIAPDGSALLYSSYIGSTGADYSGDIAVDNAGVAYITGATLNGNFPTKAPLQPTFASPGSPDAIVAKFDTTKTGAASLLYSTFLGGDDTDYGFGIAADAAGNMYVAGHTMSLNFPTKNAFQASNASAGKPEPREAFVTKINAAGSQLLYSTYLGGSGYDVGYGMDIDADGNIYITGRTDSDNFPTREAWQQARADFIDVFVARLDPTKSGDASLVYSTFLGGNDSDYSYGIAVDAARSAYITGYTGPSGLYEFPTTGEIGPNGSSDGILVAKFSANPMRRVSIPMVRR